MKNYNLILVGGILLLSACNQPTPNTDTANISKKDSFDIASVKATIVANEKIFSEATVKGDSNAVAAFYATSGKLLPENMPVIDNVEGLKSFWGATDRLGIKEFNLETIDVYGNADNVIEEGKYSLGDGRGKDLGHGKYIIVWRNENGNWKIYRDIYNSDIPTEAPKNMPKGSGSKKVSAK